jgi:hypothetical protein
VISGGNIHALRQFIICVLEKSFYRLARLNSLNNYVQILLKAEQRKKREKKEKKGREQRHSLRLKYTAELITFLPYWPHRQVRTSITFRDV